MHLDKVTVRNFRVLEDVTVELETEGPALTVLVGENNSGKTSFLEALRKALPRTGRPQFSELDYRLVDADASPHSSPPIEITLHLAEPSEKAWANDIASELSEALDLLEKPQVIRLRLTSRFDPVKGDFDTVERFVDATGADKGGGSKQAAIFNSFRRYCQSFYLSALRDAAKQFSAQGSYWRRFLSEADIDATKRQTLQSGLQALNNELIQAHQRLDAVRGQLAHAHRVVDLGGASGVTIEALPTKLFSLLSQARVCIDNSNGARIPLGHQGEGMQSLAVMLLFDAFLRDEIATKNERFHPVTAIEEPEAHLHPSAVRSLVSLIAELPGQKVISSHSGDLLAAVNPLAIRRFVVRNGKVEVRRIHPETLADKKARRQFEYHVQRSHGELLFARCWLLVEGETESVLFSGAAELAGVDLEREGVRIVECSQGDLGLLVRVAADLGIQWLCVIDDDAGLKKYRQSLSKASLTEEQLRDFVLTPYANVEAYLNENGFSELYEMRDAPKPGQPARQKLCPKAGSKPAGAYDAVGLMRDGVVPVPEKLNEVVQAVLRRASA
jgi:putative ATP-dependent endonuclease of OLD family